MRPCAYAFRDCRAARGSASARRAVAVSRAVCKPGLSRSFLRVVNYITEHKPVPYSNLTIGARQRHGRVSTSAFDLRAGAGALLPQTPKSRPLSSIVSFAAPRTLRGEKRTPE